LTAVCPDGSGVVYCYVPGGEVSIVLADGEEVRDESRDTVVIQLAARISKRRLDNRVVLLLEFEHDSVHRLGRNMGRVEE